MPSEPEDLSDPEHLSLESLDEVSELDHTTPDATRGRNKRYDKKTPKPPPSQGSDELENSEEVSQDEFPPPKTDPFLEQKKAKEEAEKLAYEAEVAAAEAEEAEEDEDEEEYERRVQELHAKIIYEDQRNFTKLKKQFFRDSNFDASDGTCCLRWVNRKGTRIILYYDLIMFITLVRPVCAM